MSVAFSNKSNYQFRVSRLQGLFLLLFVISKEKKLNKEENFNFMLHDLFSFFSNLREMCLKLILWNMDDLVKNEVENHKCQIGDK